jgi:hypothetical protein
MIEVLVPMWIQASLSWHGWAMQGRVCMYMAMKVGQLEGALGHLIFLQKALWGKTRLKPSLFISPLTHNFSLSLSLHPLPLPYCVSHSF